MTAKIKNVFFIFLSVLLSFCLGCFDFQVVAEEHLEKVVNLHRLNEYKVEDYVVNSYDVNIVVSENNVFDVSEKRSVYFNKPRHGLIIGLPLRGCFFRPDGSMVRYVAQVSDISVNDANFEKYRTNGKQYIKIGSTDEVVDGKKEYVICYKYNFGKDKITDADQFYYNIVSSEHDAPYGGITFSITMPKDFDINKLGFSVGARGSEDSSRINYSVNGNKIIGSYDGVLQKNEALTVRCELPEGYFVATGLDESFISYFLIGIFILFLIIAIFITVVSLRGKHGPLIEPVEFYPPDDLNSLDVAYIYKEGKLKNRDVTSLLVYLANKGYVKILEGSDNDGGFRITKVKEYDGRNESERKFVEGLFESGKNDVDYNDLYDKFYKTVNSVKEISNVVNFNRIFRKIVLVNFNLILVLSFVITTVLVGLNMYEISDNSFVFVVFGAIVLFIGVMLLGTNFNLIFRLIWFLIFWGLSGFIVYNERIYILVNCVGFVCVVIMLVCAVMMPKMTGYGYDMFGRIKGFRNFLNTAEKDRLEALVADDPQYFYNILPYAYVLGVSKKWIEKFESISDKKPDWYDGNGMFDIFVFDRMLLSVMGSMTQKQESFFSSLSNTSGWGSGNSGTGGGVAGGGYGGSSSSSW